MPALPSRVIPRLDGDELTTAANPTTDDELIQDMMLAPQDEVIADSEDESTIHWKPASRSPTCRLLEGRRLSMRRIICLGDCGIYLLK